MKLTKDEARILASVLEDGMYDLGKVMPSRSSAQQLISQLSVLHSRLESHGDDKRRKGRTSINDFSDLLERFSTKKNGGGK